jgi:hypothetical protein
MNGPPPDVRERIAATLRARGELDWLELWPDVMRWRGHLLEALGAVEPADADWQPRDGGWSATQVLQHQYTSSAGVREIVLALAAGRTVRDGTYDAPGEVTAHEIAPPEAGSFAELLPAFRAHSLAFAAIPEEVGATPNLTLTFPHEYFGPLHARAWFGFQALHDFAHLNQLVGLSTAAHWSASAWPPLARLDSWFVGVGAPLPR